MQMDYNLKNWSFNFFNLPVYFGEIAKDWFIVCSSLEKLFNTFLPVRYEEFYVREKLLLFRCLSSFDQNAARSP